MVLQQAQLSAASVRNMTTIRAGVSRGLSATGINNLIRSTTGAGIRRVDLLSAMRHVRGIEEGGLHVRSIRKDLLPDPARLPAAKTSILRQYSFVVEIRGTDPFTGVPKVGHLTISTDRLLTPAELESLAFDMTDDVGDTDASYSGIDVDSVVVVEGRQR